MRLPCDAATEARSAARLVSSSFDHLIGPTEYRLRDRQAERLGGLEVDDQLDFGRLLDWQVGWLGASRETMEHE